jgi:predicted porin
VFGSFGRRAYNASNPVIGYPLAYQYLTALRPDAIPATHDDLLRMRARGWLAAYPVGSQELEPGIPLVSAFRWDTGVQAHWRRNFVEVAGAVTAGTLADPHVRDNNSRRQFSGRVALHPVTGLIVGASVAHGEWLDREVMELLPADAPTYDQTAWGLDAEYSRDHWIVRAEMVKSRWQLPFAALAAAENVDALGTWVEGRYRFTPRFFAGGRIDHLGFSKISTDNGLALVTWEAPVTRVEGTAGYYLQRNLVARLTVQFNDRKGGRVARKTYVAGQLAYWF